MSRFGTKRDQDGPAVIPERTVVHPARTICDGCRYHESHTTRIGGCFGGPPVRDGYDDCSHPDVALTRPVGIYTDGPQQGELAMSVVPKTVRRWSVGSSLTCPTPDWCPYLRERNDEQKT